MTAVSDSAGTITTTVDALGRVVKTVDVWGVSTVSSYDVAGRLTAAVSSLGAWSSSMGYSYDNVGRVLEQRLDGVPVAQMSYRSDGAAVDPGVLVGVVYPAGAGNGTSGTIGYDGLGRVQSLRWLNASGGLITSDVVSRSLSGRVLSTTVDDGVVPAWQYFYDGAGRLVRAVGSGHDFVYGFAGSGGCGPNVAAGLSSNRSSVSDNGVEVGRFCVDGADRLVSSTAPGLDGAVQYDSRGNTVLWGAESYSFDGANRSVGSVSGFARVRWVRDGLGRVVERRAVDLGTGVETVTRYGFTGAGDSSSVTLDAAGVVVEQVVGLPGGVGVSRRSVGSVWSYPNVHGDVVGTADGGGVKQGVTVVYGPFGEVLAGVVPDSVVGGMDAGWLGQFQRRSDAGSGRGVIQMGVRPYVPAAGRFLGVDPVEGGNANDYVYPQDPINSFDLDGRACVSTLVPGLIIGKGRVHGKCPDTKQYRDLAARTAPAINPTAQRTRVMVTEREKRAASAPQVDLIPFCSNLGTGAKLTTTAAMELGKETLKKGVLKGVVRFIPVVNWVIWGHDAACLVQELDP